MRIRLSPQRREDTLEVYKEGKILTLNGDTVDLTPMEEGSTLPAEAISSEWFVEEVTMEQGELTLTLLLPLPYNYSQAQAFPVDLVDVPDGEVVFPAPLSPEETEALYGQPANLDVSDPVAPGDAALQMAQDDGGEE